MYALSYAAEPFWFAVARAGGNSSTIFNTSAGPLIFKVCHQHQELA